MKRTRLSILTLCASVGVFSFITGCSQEKEVAVPTVTASQQTAKVEEAFPSQTGVVRKGEFGGEPIMYQQINGENVFEGDILLTPDQIAAGRAQTESAGRTTGLWPSATVYYTINSNVPNQARITNAIAHWQANTAVRFVQRTTQANYVTFQVGSGCSSYIGMVGGRQYINLADGCSTGNTIHEIGHALGLFHEQTRTDRDNFVNILTQNIQSGYESNFSKYTALGYRGADFGALDFGSIMMYGSFSFSSNGQPTITRKDGTTFNIQRNGLSVGDKAGIDVMY